MPPPLRSGAAYRLSHHQLLRAPLLVALSVPLSLARTHAQLPSYYTYPEAQGQVQHLESPYLPQSLALDMQIRGRTEGRTSFNSTEGNDRIYELTRVFGSLTWKPAPFITGYLQFIDTHALGLPTHTIQANMRDAFDLRQGYISLQGKPAQLPIKFTAGRQELKFGAERIIGLSDFANNSRTWDGFTLQLGDKQRLTLFSTSVVTIHPTSLDLHGKGLTFHGAYGSFTAQKPKLQLLPFVLFRTVRGVNSQRNIRGGELETTFGLEADGKLPGHFDYVINGALQRGTYSTDSIHAGESFGKLSYNAPHLPWQPRIGVEYDYATGNAHRISGRRSTYDQQYPSNHNAFGLIDIFGFQNLRQERLNLNLKPAKNLSLLIQGQFLHVVQTRDDIYASAGGVLFAAPANGFQGKNISAGFDASANYIFRNYIVTEIGVSHVFPGDALITSGHGSAQTLGYLSLKYQYSINRNGKTRAAEDKEKK